MAESSGKRATRTGDKLERFVEHALKDEGYAKVRGKGDLTPCTYATQRVVGETIYGTKFKADFLTCTPSGSRLVIECKWQQTKGSVDEKYPFLVETIRLNKIPTIVVIDGDGYKPKALLWLRGQVDDVLLGVYTMKEFQQAVNDRRIF